MNRERSQAIVIRKNKALFGSGKVDSKWIHFFIGGGIESRESPKETVLREIREETNMEGEIVFQLSRELKDYEYTFLVDIGKQKPSLGYDPEEVHIPENERNLQNLVWIPLDDKEEFTDIDIGYLKLLLDECIKREYYPKWRVGLERLIKEKTKE